MSTRQRNLTPTPVVAAFVARRGELRLTQAELAMKAGVSARSVLNFEHGVWPNPGTRHKLEKAVGWPAGEIYRLSLPPSSFVDPQLINRLSELSGEQKEFLARWLSDAAHASDGDAA